MPIYEYACRDCAHEFETLQKFTDPPERVCPACEGRVARKLSRAAFHLRGGGWFNDGYGRKRDGADKSAQDKKQEGSSKSADSGGGDKSSATDGGKSSSSEGGKSSGSEGGGSSASA